MQPTFNTKNLSLDYILVDIKNASFAKNKISNKIISLAVTNLTSMNSNIKNLSTTILNRVAKNVGGCIDLQLKLKLNVSVQIDSSINNQQIQTSSNSTDLDQCALDYLLKLLYSKHHFVGDAVTYYFAKDHADLSVYSIFTLLYNSLTKEEMIKSLENMNNKLAKNQELDSHFIKDESTDVLNTNDTFAGRGIPVTLLIKSAISLRLLPEGVINDIWELIKQHCW